MPYVSEAQRRAMYAAKEGHSTLGIPKSVGADFVAAGPASSHLPEKKMKHNSHNHVDDHGMKGSHQHDHVMLENAHPHAQASHDHIHQQDVDVNPNRSTWNRGSRSIVAGTPHGQYTHKMHDRRDKGPEHHPPAGLMTHNPHIADNSGNE